MKLNPSPALIALLCAPLGSALAGTMTVNTAAPGLDNADIASLVGLVDNGGANGHVWNNRARQGQTFTTGSHPAGYTLDAYTVRVRVDQASTSAQLWNLRVGTMVGAELTPITTETAPGVPIPQSVAPDFPSYVTWTLDTPVTLLPNTVYGIDVDTNGEGGGFISLNDTANPYAGGSALTSPGTGNALGPLLHANDDRHFHVNLVEINSLDSDGDGLPNDWEIEHSLDPDDNGDTDPDNGPLGDPDMDGSNNLNEFVLRTDPRDDDSDDDGLPDGVETNTRMFVNAADTGSNPNSADTDGDLLDDHMEVDPNPFVTDPNRADTDGDSLSDFAELESNPFVTDPTRIDTDGDGFNDDVELAAGSDPTNPDDIPANGLMVVSGTAPTVDGEDIAQLGGLSDIGGDAGHAWNNRPRQGQSFTTGSNAGGYTLSAITVRARVDQASTQAPNWELRVGSLDPAGVFTPLVTELIPGATIPNGVDNWVTWILGSPLELDADSVYGYDVYPDAGGYISLGEPADALAGGSAFSSGSPGSTSYPASPPDPVTAHASDRAFHINLDASAGSGFNIIEIAIVGTPEGDALRLTWTSSPGRTYALDASSDLADWATEVDDSIFSGGATTTDQRLLADLPITGPDAFFRVRDITSR